MQGPTRVDYESDPYFSKRILKEAEGLFCQIWAQPKIHPTPPGSQITEIWYDHGAYTFDTKISTECWHPREAVVAEPAPFSIVKPRTQLVEHVLQILEAIEPLRRELKRRALIFQCEWKEAQAIAEGKSFDAYHELSYEDWSKIRDSRYG